MILRKNPIKDTQYKKNDTCHLKRHIIVPSFAAIGSFTLFSFLLDCQCLNIFCILHRVAQPHTDRDTRMGSGSLAEVIVVLLAVSYALAWNAESFQENLSSGDEHFPAPNGDKVADAADAADARVSGCTPKNPFRDSIEGSQNVCS